MDFKVGDLVQANDEAQHYYWSHDMGQEYDNSDYHRRSLTMGRIFEIAGEGEEPTIRILDLINGYTLAMRAATLKHIDHVINEQLFDLTTPPYRHF